MISENPRVRFAPSPTGYLHVGGLRTALYNYLFAKKNNGAFILRIEDTDRTRLVEGAVENLITTLKWAGLDYDEGPGKDGGFGPYVQSERLDIYKKYTDELVRQKKAYYCFCTSDRLKQLRDEQQKTSVQSKYDKHCLHINETEISEKLKNNEPYVIRLNVQPDEMIRIDDIIRGEVIFNSNVVDDQILLKSDGYPTYHLANVVDDHLMKITHVIRGEEWLSSTPKHILLYKYFGWEIPKFAHLPLLLNPDKSKLSKRQGDVAVEDYRAKGYLKEALVNFVALLGWSAGDDREFYYLDELCESFSLERVNKAGAVFNIEKLQSMNFAHLQKKSDEEFLKLLKEELAVSSFNNHSLNDEKLLLIIHSMKERINFVKEIILNGSYFLTRPQSYDLEAIKKHWTHESAQLLQKFAKTIHDIENPLKEDYENVLHKVAEEAGVKNAAIIHPLRLAVSGVSGGPGLFDILFILGKEETIDRINIAKELVKV
ncbi:MAG: glutamate--tRNA ligase [Ignavibacteriaceae bacterium]|nr:glutamate--tRNA ligase [Ignavibacteriaceae bacterium]